MSITDVANAIEVQNKAEKQSEIVEQDEDSSDEDVQEAYEYL
jgi:hypothetical protein